MDAYREALDHLSRNGLKDLVDLHGNTDLAVERWTGPQEPCNTVETIFTALSRAIIYQQLAGAAARTIYGRFLGLFDGGLPPSPAAVLAKGVEIKTAGLSGRKTEYILDLASKLEDGTVDAARLATMDDTQLADTLIQVKGIGRWTVDMFLMFQLRRPDILPVGDLAIRKGIATVFKLPNCGSTAKAALPDAEKMIQLTQCWKPYRSVGSYLMYRLVDGLKEKQKAVKASPKQKTEKTEKRKASADSLTPNAACRSPCIVETTPKKRIK